MFDFIQIAPWHFSDCGNACILPFGLIRIAARKKWRRTGLKLVTLPFDRFIIFAGIGQKSRVIV